MFICRLFHRDRPFEQVHARMLVSGETTIGRDPASDWPLEDADEVLSRTHCVLAVEMGRLMLRDRSMNGTFLDRGQRAPHDTPVEILPSQSLYLGPYMILVDAPQAPRRAPSAPAAVRPPTETPDAASPTTVAASATLPASHAEDSLLEAFCAGAKLDASAFSSEDPAELMQRIGAVYRQTVLGLAALMMERAQFKDRRGLERTTISAADNNPFKWAPTRRLAQDLLLGTTSGFLSPAQAVQASFQDLARHLAGVRAGSTAAAGYAVERLSPASIEAEARTKGAVLRGRAAVCWEIHGRRHAELSSDDPSGGVLGRAFADAYSQILEQPCR